MVFCISASRRGLAALLILVGGQCESLGTGMSKSTDSHVFFLHCRLWGCLSAQQNEKHEKAGIVGLVANRDFRLLYHIHYHTRKSKRETSSLCKKLQESKGNVTLGELSDYVRQNVLKRSTVMLNTTQTPTTSSSPKLLTQWREITIK